MLILALLISAAAVPARDGGRGVRPQEVPLRVLHRLRNRDRP